MTAYQLNRVEWAEIRPSGVFLMLAERHRGRWEFWERESWETSWSRIPSLPERITRARRLWGLHFPAWIACRLGEFGQRLRQWCFR